MKFGVFVTARLGSSRLPNKHLEILNGVAAIEWLLSRIKSAFEPEIISGEIIVVLTTGNFYTNRILEDFVKKYGFLIFYGNDINIPKRHIEAGQAYSVDAIISIDGDDLFCAPESMREVYFQLKSGVPLVKCNGLPIGFNAWGYSLPALEKSMQNSKFIRLETGWGRIFSDINQIEITHESEIYYDSIRATLDYPDDLLFFQRCMVKIPDWFCLSSKELIDKINKLKLNGYNNHLTEKYWNNFNEDIQNET